VLQIYGNSLEVTDIKGKDLSNLYSGFHFQSKFAARVCYIFAENYNKEGGNTSASSVQPNRLDVLHQQFNKYTLK